MNESDIARKSCPEGFHYFGNGPIINPGSDSNRDVRGYFKEKWWDHNCNGLGSSILYAIRKGSKLAHINGLEKSFEDIARESLDGNYWFIKGPIKRERGFNEGVAMFLLGSKEWDYGSNMGSEEYFYGIKKGSSLAILNKLEGLYPQLPKNAEYIGMGSPDRENERCEYVFGEGAGTKEWLHYGNYYFDGWKPLSPNLHYARIVKNPHLNFIEAFKELQKGKELMGPSGVVIWMENGCIWVKMDHPHEPLQYNFREIDYFFEKWKVID